MMILRMLSLLLTLLILIGCNKSDPYSNLSSSDNFLIFETTPEQISNSTDKTITELNKQLDKIASLDESEISFNNIFVSMDNIEFNKWLLANRLDFIKNSHPNEMMRKAAQKSYVVISEWSSNAYIRDDVYEIVSQYQTSEIPRIKNEREGLSEVDKRLITYFNRTFIRNGLDLSEDERKQLIDLTQQLTKLSDEYSNNFNASDLVVFTKEELDGIPQNTLNNYELVDGMYHVRTTWAETSGVYTNSPKEEVRKKALAARYSRAKSNNKEITPKFIELRGQIASLLGYKNWAEYKIKVSMMKTPNNVIEFLSNLNEGLEPKFREELKSLNELKAKDVNNKQAVVESWDIEYYGKQKINEEYDLDISSLSEYFEYNKVLNGMFKVAEEVFSLKISPVEIPYKWQEDVTAVQISDAETGEPLGLLYLDMFARDGKRPSFSAWQVVEGRQLEDGSYRKPISILLGNFPKQSGDLPVLFSFREVEILFHEFGHALSVILTQSPYAVFSGINYAPDFVETPSIMMESFVTDAGVLNLIVNKPIPEDTLNKLQGSRALNKLIYGKKQVALAQMDIDLYTIPEFNSEDIDITSYAYDVMANIFLASPEATSYINIFSHIFPKRYSSSYYQYILAAIIAADLSSKFANSDKGFMDPDIGMKYRKEILATGGTRDALESVAMFLGRPYNQNAYYQSLGISQTDNN